MRLTVDDLLAQARAGLHRLTAEEAFAAVRRGAWLVDVRTESQLRADGRIPGAVEIGLNVLEWRLDPDSPVRLPGGPALGDVVVVLCAQGYSSSLAAARLQRLGFERATDVIDGFAAWAAHGLPTIEPAATDPTERPF